MALTPEVYAEVAASTAIYPEAEHYEGAYAMLGLLNECGELFEATRFEFWNRKALVKEAGDVLWYIAEVCRQHDISFPQVFRYWNHIPISEVALTSWQLHQSLFEMAGMQKKSVRDNKLDKDNLIIKLRGVALYLACLLARQGITVEHVASENNKKLLDRQARGVLKGSGDNR